MRYEAELRGKSHRWAVMVYSEEQAKAMREDGIEVIEIHNTVPMWAVDMGLAPVWVFVQDLWDLPSRIARWFRGGKG